MHVGTLAEDRGRVYFEYAAEFLATGLNLSPFRLPFEPGLFEHRDREFGPLPGVFDDSLPDGWGLLLMDRHFRSLGRNLAEISPLDRPGLDVALEALREVRRNRLATVDELFQTAKVCRVSNIMRPYVEAMLCVTP
jgi:hypothetical protein